MNSLFCKYNKLYTDLMKCTFILKQTRNKIQRVKAPPVAKEKVKFMPKKKQIITDTPEFWGLGCTEIPVDDVWDRRLYKIPNFTLSEALRMHRELASPEMMDNMEGILTLNAQLDLSTKKKTKFLGVMSGIVLLPHNYDNMIQGRVLTITKTDEDQRLAVEAGAIYSGGLDLIRKLEKGEITADEYDCVVLNPDLLLEASIIKRVLQDRFPSKKKGNLGNNISEMVNLFTNGRQYDSTKISDAVGRIVLPFGKLSMEDKCLYENLKAAVDAISSQKPNSKLIVRIGVTCPPSKEFFVIEDKKIMADAGREEEDATRDSDEAVQEENEQLTAINN